MALSLFGWVMEWIDQRSIDSLSKAFSKAKHMPCQARGSPDEFNQKGPRREVICKEPLCSPDGHSLLLTESALKGKVSIQINVGSMFQPVCVGVCTQVCGCVCICMYVCVYMSVYIS